MPSLLGKADPIELDSKQFANWKYELVAHMDKSMQKFMHEAKFSLLMAEMLSMDKRDQLVPSYKIMIGTIKNYIDELNALKQD